MPRTVKTLSMAQIWKLPRGLHAVGGSTAGLVVRVSAADRRWRLRVYLDGQQREYDLAGLDELTLAQAREAADAMRARLLKKAKALTVVDDSDNPFLGPIARALLAETA